MLATPFGDGFQIAFVPDDFDAAIQDWLTVGAGPFFVLRNRVFRKSVFRGQPVNTAIDVALGYWGDVQIEIIHQLDDGPSIYREFRDGDGRGMHHLAILVPDLEAARERCRKVGYDIAHEITSGEMDLFYATPHQRHMPILEFMVPPPGMVEFYDMMKAARRDWDGVTDPIRARQL